MKRARRPRFWGPDVDADVDEELRFHLEACAADLEAQGHPPAEARRLARARFGDVAPVRDWMRDHDRQLQRRARRAESMGTMWQDLRYAGRKLRQQPAFAMAVVLVLALGIGAATAMFSAVDAAFLRPLPFVRDDRLVTVADVEIPMRDFAPPPGATRTTPVLDDLRAMRGVFAGAAAYAPGGLNLTDAGAPLRVRVALVTRDFLPTLGIRAALGRNFSAEEAAPDGPRVAILSDALFRRQFGGDTSVLHRDVRLNGVPHRVVGVMPRGVVFPSETDVWLPMTEPMTFARWDAFRQTMPSVVVARLAPGANAHTAAARIIALVRALRGPEGRAEPIDADSVVVPLRDALVGNRSSALLVLFGATALVLLVACANAASLLLARAAARRGEIALRATLGATRGRILRQLLVESLLLSVAGAVLGVVLAYASLGAMHALMPTELAGTAPPRVDARVLAFSLALALLTGLAFGLWPAAGAARVDAAETIKASGSGRTASRQSVRLRRSLVVAELALALMLAVGAGLMLRSFRALVTTDIGVRAEHAATLELSLPNAKYRATAERRRFYAEVLARLAATPGVEAAGFVNNLPLSPNRGIGLRVSAVGRATPTDEALQFPAQNSVTDGYFRAAGIPLLRGRAPGDDADTTRRTEVVINERMSRAFWPGEDPIGKLLVSFDTEVVVGIVRDVRSRAVERPAGAQMYISLMRSASQNVALVARGTLPPDLIARRLSDAVQAVDRSQAVFNVRSMHDVVGAALAPRRANTLLITAFGLLALGLAAVGVYGVIAYAVASRTREIGIRMALGARRGDVLLLMLAEGLPLALGGVALGLVGAWAVRRVIASLLYGVTPADPTTFAVATLVLLAIAIAATLVPARAAMRVDPAMTIKQE